MVKKFHLEPLDVLKREKALFIEVAKKSEDLEAVDVIHNKNLNLLGNSLNTGFKPNNRKLMPVKRRSSFGQPLSRAMPIPLNGARMASNEMFFNRRSAAALYKSAVALSHEKDSGSDHEISIDKPMGTSLRASKAFGNVSRSAVSSLPKCYENSPGRKSNIPPLPVIDENPI